MPQYMADFQNKTYMYTHALWSACVIGSPYSDRASFLPPATGGASEGPLYNFKTANATATKITQRNVVRREDRVLSSIGSHYFSI